MSCLYPPVYLGATASLPSIIGLVPKALAGEQDKVLTGAGTWTATPIFTSLGINVATGVTPFCELEVDSTSTSSPRGIMSAQFNTGTDGARFHFRKARGTRAAPTTVVTGDNLGRLVGTGYDGSNYLEMASIYFATEGTIAATRVPTNIQFWTATDATPSVLTLALKINSAQQALFADGTAALPSIGFGSTTTTGFYSAAATTIGLASGGVAAATFTRDVAGGGLDITAQGTNTNLRLAAAGTGTTSLVANGSSVTVAGTTNGSITLTPSGTGGVSISSAKTADGSMLALTNTASTGYAAIQFLNNASAVKAEFGWGNSGASSPYANNAYWYGAGAFVILPSGVEKARFAATTGNLLLGGLTTDGTGVLQFPAAITSAGGITMGTDVNIYRFAAANLYINATTIRLPNGSDIQFNGSSDRIYGSGGSLQVISGGNLMWDVTPSAQTFKTNGTTALTLDSSQNATFAGINIFTSGSATGSNSARWVGSNGGNGMRINVPSGNTVDFGVNGVTAAVSVSSTAVSMTVPITTYNNIATAGNGVVSVQAAGRATAQTGANASVSTYTVGAADASFEVSANILVTTATTHAFTCTCAYTDEGNTARTITFTFSNVGGTLLTSIANTGGTVPYEGVPLHIRAKASTSITIATTGTFTSVVYNVEGNIRKIA